MYVAISCNNQEIREHNKKVNLFVYYKTPHRYFSAQTMLAPARYVMKEI